MGFVTGVTAATTPIGFATKTRLVSVSSPITPRDFLFFKLFQITRAFPLFLSILSSKDPISVSSTAIFAKGSALSYTNLPMSRTTASTCFCVNDSYSA